MTPPIPLDEALRLLLAGYGLLGREEVTVGEAAGRILAAPVIATHDQPPAPMSAMDGFAVRSADIAAGAMLRLIGEAPAGAPFGGSVSPGECVAVATGGVVPDGADRVIMQEHVTREGDRVTIDDLSGPPFVRPKGMDFAAGQELLAVGALLSPAAIGLAASSGSASVTVARRPRVAIIASGDELREPGAPLGPGAMYDSASFALAALVEAWGGEAVRVATLPDELEPSIAALRAIDRADVYLPIGGASVGKRDVLRPAFEALGAAPVFSRIAVIPGKPSWHARLADGRAVLGLPGNPSSAFVCAHLLLRPLLAALTGRDSALPLIRARLGEPLPANGPREAWLRATLTIEDGMATVTADARQDSGLQTPLAASNALLRRAAHAPAASPGEMVDLMRIG